MSVAAPVDGVVLKRIRESESIVPAGDPLLEIGDPRRLEMVADLLSTDAVRVKPGAPSLTDCRHDVGIPAIGRQVSPDDQHEGAPRAGIPCANARGIMPRTRPNRFVRAVNDFLLQRDRMEMRAVDALLSVVESDRRHKSRRKARTRSRRSRGTR